MQGEYVIQKRMGFLTAAMMGLSGVMITAIACGAIIVGYGMRILDRKTDNLAGLARAAVEGLPQIRAALPPVLADVIDDERRPDYVPSIEVTTRLVPDSNFAELFRPVIEIKNTGKEVVSMLTLHSVLVDADGAPLAEWTEYAATPISGGGDLRGPLMPGAKRVIRGERLSKKPDRTLSCEIAELRVWVRNAPRTTAPVPTDADAGAEGASTHSRGSRSTGHRVSMQSAAMN